MRADVLVAGGGPAGASAALILARAGFETIVVERAIFPRTKPCGEYLSPGAVRQLAGLGLRADDLSPALIAGVRLNAGGARASLRFREPGWSLPRAELDDALLRSAVAAGARVVRGRAEDVTIRADGVAVRFRGSSGDLEEMQARLLIGADGAQSIVARKCGLASPPGGRGRFALGGHYAGFSGLDDFVEMFVDGRTYFAVNPFCATRANVMLIVEERDLEKRRSDVAEFVSERAQRLSAGRRAFSGARLEGKRVAFGPLAHRTSAKTSQHVLLAGDAAHFVDPFTGQGVYLALRSGRLAAEAVIEALRTSAEQNVWMRYEATFTNEIAQRHRLATLVGTIVRLPALARRAARVIERDPLRARALIDAVAGIGPVRDALRAQSLAKLIA